METPAHYFYPDFFTFILWEELCHVLNLSYFFPTKEMACVDDKLC